MDNAMGNGGVCKCKHHKVVPLAITLIGLTFLLQAFNVMMAETVAWIWPILLMVIGIMKMMRGSCKCCNN
jgi:hypothetical protein